MKRYKSLFEKEERLDENINKDRKEITNIFKDVINKDSKHISIKQGYRKLNEYGDFFTASFIALIDNVQVNLIFSCNDIIETFDCTITYDISIKLGETNVIYGESQTIDFSNIPELKSGLSKSIKEQDKIFEQDLKRKAPISDLFE